MRLWGPTAEITDFTSEIIDAVKRKRNDYLVLGTLNILSYIIHIKAYTLLFIYPFKEKKLNLLQVT